MILVRSLRLEEGEEISALKAKAAKVLRCKAGDIGELKLVKRSLDARKKNDIHYVCSVAVSVADEARYLRRANKDIAEYKPPVYNIPQVSCSVRPVVVGFGPAGMFAALVLARSGAKPIVLERGQAVEKRTAAVEAFRHGGALDTENNVQFGEGGAGTFSDGKLGTGTHDSRMSWVLQEFYLHGAAQSVTYDAKPHVGTDVLVDVVRNIRNEIISLGGEVRFGCRFESFLLEGEQICGLEYTQGGELKRLDCRLVILALGHSARDTFEKLYAQGINMEQKPFSMGVRIEHLQSSIDVAQYGRERGKLPPADYSLNVHLPDGSSAYTFCMCPGGQVFAAASELGGLVTNGMSYSKRDGVNANSALLVTLRTEDFPSSHVLAGMYWQREIEQRAYNYTGGYRAPAQLVGDFLSGKASTGAGRVKPSYEPGVVWGDMRQVLPEKKKLKGFDDPEAVMTGPETRSSSPVRIVRGSDLQGSVRGLYPCGEGAGYAGGITSAAVDGLRCAERVLENISNSEE
jgi:hypothetical protein